MWVYQETETNAAALVPTLPEDTAGESLAEKEAMTPVSEPLAELPPQKAPRRKPFQASRDCILLAAAYLFGTLMAGVLQALCDAEEMETLAYYLDCWRGVFAASSTAQAVGLFGAELAVVLGAAAGWLLQGLSAEGIREAIRQEHGSWWGNSPYWQSVSARSAVRPPALCVLQIV